MLLSSGIVGYFTSLLERAFELERTVVLREQQIKQQLTQEALVYYAQQLFQEYRGDLKEFYSDKGEFIQTISSNPYLSLKFIQITETSTRVEQLDDLHNTVCQLANLSYENDVTLVTWLC